MHEESLRAAKNLRGSPGMRLSAWRGRSGRRYVVGIHALSEADVSEMAEAVVLAVRRDADGTARLLDSAGADEAARATDGSPDGSPDSSPDSWARRFAACGATELHVHHLAETAAERRAVLADLGCAGEA